MLFRKQDIGTWLREEKLLPFLNFQDPFVTEINGETVFGGVEYPIPNMPPLHAFRTVIYRGPNIFSLERFAEIPGKCNRLVEDGLYTRPQSPDGAPPWYIGGRGQVGFIPLESIDQILKLRDYHNPDTLVNAPHGLFVTEETNPDVDPEWGGFNDSHKIRVTHNGSVHEVYLVFGHIARYSPETVVLTGGEAFHPKEYYPMVCLHNPQNNRASTPAIIATIEDFGDEVPAKRLDLFRVVYKGGANISPAGLRDGEHYVHFGVGDATAYDAKLNPVFLEEYIEKAKNEVLIVEQLTHHTHA